MAKRPSAESPKSAPKKAAKPSAKASAASKSEPAPRPTKAPRRAKPSIIARGEDPGVGEHQLYASTSMSDPKSIKAFAIDAARTLSDDKCEDVQLLHVSGISQVSDYIIIASGTSDRQMSSSADDMEAVGVRHGWKTFRRHDDDRTTWIVVDFVDVVVHIFEPNTRAHYDLEMLWADAPRLEWERPDQVKR
ncbi:MAG: ribosome silencing factor, partial [Phycisphaerales bacterium]|nr:ribosome silencing factor [Phycisphaerales bacterium]